jgi:hypothetical protein
LALLGQLGCSERNTEVVPGVGERPDSSTVIKPELATFWLDARSGVDFREDGAAIWTDQSPAKHDAQQADPALRPDAGAWVDGVTLVPEFAATDSMSLPPLEFSGADGVVLFILLRRFDTREGTPLLLSGGDGRAPLGFHLLEPDGVAANLRGTRYEVERLLPAGSTALLTLRTGGDMAELRINGVVAKRWNGPGAYDGTRSDNFLGLGFSGQLAFAALLTTAAPDDELARFERALGVTWGCCAE